MVVTICKFLFSRASGALFALHAVTQPAVNESAVNTDKSFFKIYTSGLKEAERILSVLIGFRIAGEVYQIFRRILSETGVSLPNTADAKTIVITKKIACVVMAA